MLRELEVFETSDGKRHDDKRKAEEHVADALREALDKRLIPLVDGGKLSRNDTFRIVMALIPDLEAAEALHAHFTRWLNYGD